MKPSSFFLLAGMAVICLGMISCGRRGHKPLPEALTALEGDAGVLASHVPVPDWDNGRDYIFRPHPPLLRRPWFFTGARTATPGPMPPSLPRPFHF